MNIHLYYCIGNWKPLLLWYDMIWYDWVHMTELYSVLVVVHQRKHWIKKKWILYFEYGLHFISVNLAVSILIKEFEVPLQLLVYLSFQ